MWLSVKRKVEAIWLRVSSAVDSINTISEYPFPFHGIHTVWKDGKLELSGKI